MHALVNTFFVKNYKNYSTASILLRVGQIFESSSLNQKGGSSTLIANLGPVWIHVLELVWVSLNSTNPKISKQEGQFGLGASNPFKKSNPPKRCLFGLLPPSRCVSHLMLCTATKVERKMRKLNVFLLINSIACNELTTACHVWQSQVIESMHRPHLLLVDMSQNKK